MKRTVFLINIPEEVGWGGCDARLMDYFSFTDHTRHELVLVTTKDVYSARIRDRNLPVRVLQFPFSVPGTSWRSLWRMWSLLQELKADSVVFVLNGFFQFKLPDFAAGFLATGGRVYSLEVLGAPPPPAKVPGRYLGVIPRLGLWWYRWMVPLTLRGWLSRRILAVSEEVKVRLVSLYHYPEHRIHVVYHGIDIGHFSPDAQARMTLRKSFGFSDADILINCTARLSRQKRQDRLIQAFDAAFGDSPDVHLLLVGDGEEEQGYRKVAAESRSRARIQFLGHSDRVADLMRMSDVFVLPSDNEGFARTLMEAMSSGLLAVSTRTPGSTELIRSEVNGFLCETSVESLTEALARCRQLPDADRIRMTSRARDMISTEFRLDNRVRQALNLLDLPAIPIPAESGKLS